MNDSPMSMWMLVRFTWIAPNIHWEERSRLGHIGQRKACLKTNDFMIEKPTHTLIFFGCINSFLLIRVFLLGNGRTKQGVTGRQSLLGARNDVFVQYSLGPRPPRSHTHKQMEKGRRGICVAFTASSCGQISGNAVFWDTWLPLRAPK